MRRTREVPSDLRLPLADGGNPPLDVCVVVIAIWRKWVEQGQWWWLALIAAVLLADVLIGSWLLAWEIRTLKEVMR